MNSLTLFYRPMDTTTFRQLVSANGLQLTEELFARLIQYGEFLREWNQKVNLISRKDEENVLSRHILHSLALAFPVSMPEALPDEGSVLDIGCGGGLPGIPLAIVRPELSFTLVDSIQKKITAVSDMIARLGLTNAQALTGRAEEMKRAKKLYPTYSTVVSRAVAPLDDLVKWTRDLLLPGAVLYSLKGGDLSEEINRTRKMSIVADVDAWPIALSNYDDFEKEGKQIVKVNFR
jgi:16S rRNA (guanine527-N7)-methyltransferase